MGSIRSFSYQFREDGSKVGWLHYEPAPGEPITVHPFTLPADVEPTAETVVELHERDPQPEGRP